MHLRDFIDTLRGDGVKTVCQPPISELDKLEFYISLYKKILKKKKYIIYFLNLIKFCLTKTGKANAHMTYMLLMELAIFNMKMSAQKKKTTSNSGTEKQSKQ